MNKGDSGTSQKTLAERQALEMKLHELESITKKMLDGHNTVKNNELMNDVKRLSDELDAMSFYNQFTGYRIFLDKKCLDKSYTPTGIRDIIHRKEQIDVYMRHLSDALNNIVPGNMLIYGKMGTGKTMVTKILTKYLQAVAMQRGIKIKPIYIHGEAIPTSLGIFRFINHSLMIELSKEITKIPNAFDAYFFKFCQLIKEFNGIIIVILDEIDKLENPDILNLLARIKESGYTDENICIIGITNDIRFDETLDARTLSILTRSEIIFPPYDANQLSGILRQRAEMAFMPGVLEDTVIPLCAALIAQEHGDARKALELLMISGIIAEEKKSQKVTEEHVRLANERVERDKVSELIRMLPTQSKITLVSCIYIGLKGEKISQTSDVYNVYKGFCRDLGIDVLTQRRITDLLTELSAIGLINSMTVSKGRYGRTKQVSLAIPVNSAIEVLMEDYRLNSLRDINVFKDVERSKEAEIVQMNLRSFR